MNSDSPSETLRDILEAVEGHGKYHTSAYDGPVMSVDQAYEAILNKLPEKQEWRGGPTDEKYFDEGFNRAIDTLKQLLEGK